MECVTEVVVKRIGGKYHARLMVNGRLFDEMACNEKRDIGFICRTMLRWADKTGASNAHTDSARRRLGEESMIPLGKIYYRTSHYLTCRGIA